jgi:Ca-activated chloride channel family protein
MNEEIGLVTRDGVSIALRGVEVDARILGLVAETSLSQRYRNDTSANLEVAYTFPLPVDGVLLDFEALLGGRSYRGTVMLRREAESKYEHAVEQGDAAFRLQKLHDGLYTATLGNLKPGEEVEIRLRYGETLRWQAGRLRYRLPTVIAPRYGQPTGMQPWQKPVTDLNSVYPFALRIQVLGDLARAGFECTTHRIAFAAAEGATTITLQGQAWLDRDFVLDIQTGNIRSLGAIAEALGCTVALVNLLPPAVTAPQPSGRDYVLLLDCSGSMAGDSIAHAKTGVALALKSLNPVDRFAVIGFGSSTLAFDLALQPANRKNLGLANDFVDQLPDLGGTEMEAALELALSYGKTLDILLLTDGECWHLEGAAEKAKTQGSRIFTVGIGSAVAEDTVRMLADATGGACELLTPNEDMATRIAAHFDRMRQPRITQTELVWGQTPAWTVESQHARFAGDSSLIWAELNETVGEIKAALQIENGPSITETIALTQSPQLADSLVRLAAAARLPQLAGQDYLDWSLRYQLVTEETDYLITVERAEADKASELPQLQVVPQMLAAGWGGTGSVASGGIRASRSRAPMMMSFADDAVESLNAKYDVPTAVRSRRSTPLPAPNNWNVFVTALEKRASRNVFASLPTTLKDMTKLGLPMKLAEVLREFVAQGEKESVVVRIALDLIRDHANLNYPDAVLALLAVAPNGSPALVESIRQAFDALDPTLWLNGDHGSTGIEVLDIPAFLRKNAD